METTVRCAQPVDRTRLISFLNQANLGTEGVEESIDFFLIMEDENNSIQATLGIEPLGKIGLLRSLAMTSQANEHDLFMIFEQMLKLSKEKKLEKLYLATNKSTTIPFFSLLGFKREELSLLPKELFRSQHVNHILNVDNSIFMVLELN